MAAHTHPLPLTAPRHPLEVLKVCYNLNSGQVTDTTPISGARFLTPGVALATVDAFTKFKECGFIPKTIT